MIVIFLAPFLPGLIIIGNRETSGLKLGCGRRFAEFDQGCAIKAGCEERFNL
jgi:hypothetical protein